MRLGIKGKQIAGVTAIVGVAVVALTRAARDAARRGRAAREPRARRSCSPTRSSTARARSSPAARIPYAALRTDPGLRAILESSIYGESVTDAVDPRHAGDDRRVERSDAGRAAAARRAPIWRRWSNDASPLEQLRRDLLAGGPDARGAAADAPWRRGVRLDPHRRLDAADAAGAERVAAAGARHGGDRARRCRARRGVSRAAPAAADSRHPQRPDAPRQGRVRRHARPAAGRRVRRAGHVLQHRQPAALGRSNAARRTEGATCSRRSSTSRMPSRCSTRRASCSSATRRCSRRCRRTRSAARCSGLLPAGHPYRTIVEETLATRKSRGPVHVKEPGAGGGARRGIRSR